MSSSDCECEDNGPEFILNPALGTVPCPAPGATCPTPTTPCDINACSNYFRTEESFGANNFFYTAGGPFAFDPLTHLVGAVSTFSDPGPLDGVVCVPNLPPGTYIAEVRAELLGDDQANDTQFTAIVFPSCDDLTTSYVVAECAGTAVTCSGFLYFEVTTCTPGFEIFGCGAFQNFQISIRRISGRTLSDVCAPLLPADTSAIGTACIG